MSFRSHIVGCLLKAIVAKYSTEANNLNIEGKLINFYQYLRTINKQSSAFAIANLGLEYRGISDRWLSKLSKKDRGENILKFKVTNIYNNIKIMIEAIMTVMKGILTFPYQLMVLNT